MISQAHLDVAKTIQFQLENFICCFTDKLKLTNNIFQLIQSNFFFWRKGSLSQLRVYYIINFYTNIFYRDFFKVYKINKILS